MALPTIPLHAQNTQLTIQTTGKWTVAGGFIILKDVNLNCNGQWQSNTGTALFSGNNNSSAGGTGTIRLSTMEVAKSQPVTLTLNGPLQITNAIQFNKGLIDLNGQQLQLADNAKLIGESDQSRITSPAGGKIVASAANVNAPNQLNLGNLGAMLTSPANLGTLTVTRSQLPALTGGPGIQRTYLIQPQNNTALDATLRFYYLDAELNGNDPGTLNLWKSTDGIAWALIGSDTRDATNHYVEKTGIADFSYWTLAGVINPLPLKLTSFSATCKDNTAIIAWTTGSESQLNEFVIHCSIDGTNWTQIGSVPAQNAPNGANYSFTDATPQPGSLYRLEILDQDASSTYSPIFHGGCSEIALPLGVYPNPATGQATVQISLRQATTGKLQVLTIAGQIIYETQWNLQPGLNQWLIPLSGWASGSYLLRLVLPDGTHSTLLIKK